MVLHLTSQSLCHSCMNMNGCGASEGWFSCWCMSDSGCLVKSKMMLMERRRKQLVTSCDSGGRHRHRDCGTNWEIFCSSRGEKMPKFILMPTSGREPIKNQLLRTIAFFKATVRKSNNNKQTLTSSRMMWIQYHWKHKKKLGCQRFPERQSNTFYNQEYEL